MPFLCCGLASTSSTNPSRPGFSQLRRRRPGRRSCDAGDPGDPEREPDAVTRVRATVNRSRSMVLRWPVVGLVPPPSKMSTSPVGSAWSTSTSRRGRGRRERRDTVAATRRGRSGASRPDHRTRIAVTITQARRRAPRRAAPAPRRRRAPRPGAGRSGPCGRIPRRRTGAAGPRCRRSRWAGCCCRTAERVEVAAARRRTASTAATPSARISSSSRSRSQQWKPSAASPARAGRRRQAGPLETAAGRTAPRPRRTAR